MRWEDEPYVKLYTRPSPDFLALTWQARGVFDELMKAVDRAGVLKSGKLGLKAIAVAIRAPWIEVEAHIRELVADGCIVFDEERGAICIPNFLEAQDAKQSDAARKRKSREVARSQFDPASSRDVTAAGREVTSGHDPSRIEEKRSDQTIPEGAPTEGRDSGVVPISRRSPPDPFGDSALGQAWANGVADGARQVTTAPGRGETQKLVAAVKAHCPASSLEGRAAWLLDAARTYGEAARDRTRNVWKFVEWLDAGRSFGAREGPAGSRRPVQPVPEGGRLWKVGEQQ